MGKNTLNIPSKYTTPLGYRKDGRPIFLIAGGDDNPNNPVPATSDQPPVGQGETFFTKADIDAAVEKARQQEKEKLYGRIDSLNSKVTTWEQERQAEREAAEEARKQAEAEARRKEDENLSAKELLARKEQEWQQQIESVRKEQEERLNALQSEREQERALLEKEREFAALQAYTQKRLADESDSIAPQFHDFVSGRNQQEIDQAIEVAKAKSAEVAQQVQAALQQARSQQRGASVTGYAPVGPMDVEGGQRQLSAQDIANMPMDEYAKHRASLIGSGASNNVGLFGR